MSGDDARVAVITGGNRGIGAEVARQLCQRGWTVWVGSRDLAKGQRTAAAMNARGAGRAEAVRLDVADGASVLAAAAQVASEHEAVDALVNNAAIMYDTANRATTVDLAAVHTGFETNLFGAWRTAQAFLPLLRRSNSPRVVNVSSEGGSLTSMGAGTPTYSTSKAALNALTRVLAAELQPDRVLVNAVCPGWTDTDMGRGGRPVADGARSVLWAVLLADDGPTGGFFRDGRPLPW